MNIQDIMWLNLLTQTSSHHVIPVLDKIFSMFGISKIVKSDNGPPFQGGEFHEYVTIWKSRTYNIL